MLTVRNTRLPKLTPVAATLFVLTFAACGGGGSGPGPGPIATATPIQTATPVPQTVQGTVLLIPVDGFGPVTLTTATSSVTYAPADIANTSPLANATVIVGPVPIIGATPPATLPVGDVSVTTTPSGTFSATIGVQPAAPTSAEPFVIPRDNITNFAPPTTGYYLEIFGAGADGLSAGRPIPLHRFLSLANSTVFHVSTPSAAEAGALSSINLDRASNAGAGALIFDESAEEAARLHASDNMGCHYNAQNIGPASRYLNIGGGGLTGEGVSAGGGTTAVLAFQQAESGFLSEKPLNPPNNGHYTNLIDSAHLWAGLGAVSSPAQPNLFIVDYELVTPNDQDAVVGADGYTNSGCTAFSVNNS